MRNLPRVLIYGCLFSRTDAKQNVCVPLYVCKIHPLRPPLPSTHATPQLGSKNRAWGKGGEAEMIFHRDNAAICTTFFSAAIRVNKILAGSGLNGP